MILYMPDVHLAQRTWTNSHKLTGDAYAALNKLTAYADAKYEKNKEYLDLFIGGDWYDSNAPHVDSILATLEFFGHFRDVYYIRGNHDSVQPSYMDICKRLEHIRVHNLDGEFHQCGTPDIWYTGISYCSRDKLMEALDMLPDAFFLDPARASQHLYLLLHTPMKHLLGFNDAYQLDVETLQTKLSRFAKGQVTVLVGDIHKRDTKQFDTGPIDFIHSGGSMYPRSFPETENRSEVTVLHPATGIIANFDCTVRDYYRYNYTTPEDWIAFRDKVYAEAVTHKYSLLPYVRVYMGVDQLINVLSHDPKRVLVDIEVRMEGAEVAEMQTSGATLSLTQAAIEEAGGEGALADMAEALVASNDPVEEINQWLEYWKVARL